MLERIVRGGNLYPTNETAKRSVAQIHTLAFSLAHGTNRFFRRVLGLRMIHRSPGRLEALLRPAGFGDFVALPEPMGMYQVLLGRKGSEAEVKARF